MNQPSLFDTSPTDDTAPITRRARRFDPPTSHAGASHIGSSSGYLRGLFVGALEKNGTPMTANEIASAVVACTSGVMAESVRKRAKELLREGVIRESGVRACRITGRPAQTYKISNKQ